MTAELQEVEWKSQTDVSDEHTGGRIGAESVMAGFTGSKYVIDRIKELLTHEKELDDLTVRQLRFALLEAANAPATNRELLSKRIGAEARLQALQREIDAIQRAFPELRQQPRPPRSQPRGSGEVSTAVGRDGARSKMSRADRKRIAEAQKKRWAEWRARRSRTAV